MLKIWNNYRKYSAATKKCGVVWTTYHSHSFWSICPSVPFPFSVILNTLVLSLFPLLIKGFLPDMVTCLAFSLSADTAPVYSLRYQQKNIIFWSMLFSKTHTKSASISEENKGHVWCTMCPTVGRIWLIGKWCRIDSPGRYLDFWSWVLGWGEVGWEFLVWSVWGSGWMQ